MIDLSSKILIVDDFEITRTFQKKLLMEMGYTHIEEAENGQVAKDKILHAIAQNSSYQLLLSDWQMPHMNGLELLDFIRSQDQLKELIFIILTTETESTLVPTAMEKGANDYIMKPFSRDLFLKKLKKFQAN